MSSLKSLVSNIEKENVLEEKKLRQLRTNPSSIPFDVKFPVAQKDCTNEELQKRLAQACRNIGDVQKSSTNVQASMTGWYMHETNSDFMEVCRMAMDLAYENSPRQGVPLCPMTVGVRYIPKETIPRHMNIGLRYGVGYIMWNAVRSVHH